MTIQRLPRLTSKYINSLLFRSVLPLLCLTTVTGRADAQMQSVRLPSQTAQPLMVAVYQPKIEATMRYDPEVLRLLAHSSRVGIAKPRFTVPPGQVRMVPNAQLFAPDAKAPGPEKASIRTISATPVAPGAETPTNPTTSLPATPAAAAPTTATPNAAPTTPTPPAAVVAPVPVPAPAAPPLARDANGVPLITNVFVETDLKQALADISAETGVPIIADNTVQGTVSADLKDVPLELALTMLLQTGGYSLVKMDGYYLVGLPDPANPNFYLLSRTEVIELNHLSPRVVLDLLAIPYGRYLSAENFVPAATDSTRDGIGQSATRRSVGGLSGGAGGNNYAQRLGNSSPSVNMPPESDKISITAPPNLLERIKADIARLDQPRSQVMLEAVVLEISEESLKEVGLDFTTRFLSGSLLSGVSNLTYSAIGGNETARLTALVRNGTARLRANPRVSTAEGQTAEIEVGRENYFEIDTGSNSFSFATLEVIKSGILLRITPKVLEGSGEVMARIEPEVRDVTGRSSNGLPEITFRRAATNMRVRDGESIVIGGLINEFSDVTRSKIPILGDIPIIGKIFRGTNSRKNKTEVVIIITPRILTEGIPDRVKDPILQNDLNVYREGGTWEPFAFPVKKK